MTADEQLKELIQHFDSPLNVGCACHNVHGQTKFFLAPTQVCEAYKRGFIKSIEDKPPVDSSSNEAYSREYVLTDEGRKFCGLPLMKTPTPMKKKASTGSLFD